MKILLNEEGLNYQEDEVEKLERSIRILRKENMTQKKQMKKMSSTFGKRPRTSTGQHYGPTHRSVVNTVQPAKISSSNKTKLLKTIDSLKRQLFQTNDKCKRLQQNLSKSRQQGGGVAVSELKDKDNALTMLKGKLDSHIMGYEALSKRYESGQEKLKELNMLLNDTKKEKISLERENLNLRNEASQVTQLQDQLSDQKASYKMLQAQYDDLCDSPFSDNDGPKVTRHEMNELKNQIDRLKNDLTSKIKHNEILEDQNQKQNLKIEKLEDKMEKKQDELNNLKVESMEKAKSLGTYQRQMDILNLDNKLDQDLFHKVLGQVKWQGEEPAWHRIEFIERTHEIDWNDTGSLKKEIDRLRTEKGQIAAQLQQQETQIELMMEMQNEKNHLHEVEIQRLNLTIKSHELRIQELIRTAEYSVKDKFSREKDAQKLATIVNDVRYDKPVSVFSDEQEQDIEPGFNFLDVWFGEADFEPSQLIKMKIFSDEVGHELQTLVTSDFYNFDTESSGICEGITTNYNLQISYKVQIDDYLLKYFERHSINVEVFVSAGLDIQKIGDGKIPLKDLIELNTGKDDKESAVIDKRLNIIGVNKDEMIGRIRFKARMRNPISQFLKLKRAQELLGIGNVQTIKKEVLDVGERTRVLHISITKSSGLPKDVKSFVTYQLFNEQDEFSKALIGSNPQYNFIQKHELVEDSDLTHYLQVSHLEFQVFDDNIPIMPVTSNQEDDALPQDFIGKAKVELYPLTKNKMINTDLQILNAKNKQVGTLHIRIYWKDYKEPFKDRIEDAEMTKNWEFQTTKKIADSIKVRELGINAAFNIFDFDRDQEISYGDFKYTIQETFQLGISDDELVLYWRKIFADRPTSNKNMTKKEFIQKFHNLVGKQPEENLGEINRMFNQHDEEWRNRQGTGGQSAIIKRVQREVASVVSIMIRTKMLQLTDVFDDIANFKQDFSIYEFAAWLQRHSVFLSAEEKQHLLHYYDQDQDGMISKSEFLQGVRLCLSETILQEEKSYNKSGGGQGTNTSQLIENVKNDIWNFMKKNDINYYELFIEMDKNQDDQISKQEFKKWITKRITSNLTEGKLESLMDHFDSNKDGTIQVYELKKVLTKQNSRRLSKAERDQRPSIKKLGGQHVNAMNAAIKIVKHLKQNKKSIMDWFMECDTNSNGSINRNEIRAYVKKNYDIKIETIEIADLCTYLDCNCDDEITIKELKVVLMPLMENTNLNIIKPTVKKLTISEKKTEQAIITKIKSKIIENKNQIESLFKTKEIAGKKNFITSKNFGIVMRNVNTSFKLSLTRDELSDLKDYVADINSEGNLNYAEFLQKVQTGKDSKRLSDSERKAKDKRQTTRINKVLKNIKDTLQSKNIKYKDAFKKFDMDGDKRINSMEFKKSFDLMKINISQSDVEFLVRKYGSSEKGYILYDDFIEAFENL